MMNYDILKILSYVVVYITTLTMVFGVVAYRLYKVREKRVANYNKTQTKEIEKDEHLYFEKKEILW